MEVSENSNLLQPLSYDLFPFQEMNGLVQDGDELVKKFGAMSIVDKETQRQMQEQTTTLTSNSASTATTTDARLVLIFIVCGIEQRASMFGITLLKVRNFSMSFPNILELG